MVKSFKKGSAIPGNGPSPSYCSNSWRINSSQPSSFRNVCQFENVIFITYIRSVSLKIPTILLMIICYCSFFEKYKLLCPMKLNLSPGYPIIIIFIIIMDGGREGFIIIFLSNNIILCRGLSKNRLLFQVALYYYV